VYVLTNVRKHLPGARGIDPRSSAPWFSGRDVHGPTFHAEHAITRFD
jgi:hypothetical protein